MERKKIVASLFIVFAIFFTSAQVSFNAGGSLLKGFGTKKPWGGVHFGLEFPRDDASSFYGRITHYFKQSVQDSVPSFVVARDPATTPYTQSVNSLPSMNYTIIEGGSRYYLGNGFDYGWSGYGGTTLMLVFNKVKATYAPYDESLYKRDVSSDYAGSIFSLAFGLGGGVKYSMAPYGTFYFDFNVAYMIFAQGSTANVYSGLYNPLIFNFNLGYRRDIYW